MTSDHTEEGSLKLEEIRKMSPETVHALIAERDIKVEAVGEHESFSKVQELPDIIPKQENVHKEQAEQKDIFKGSTWEIRKKRKNSPSPGQGHDHFQTPKGKNLNAVALELQNSHLVNQDVIMIDHLQGQVCVCLWWKDRTKRKSSRSPSKRSPYKITKKTGRRSRSLSGRRTYRSDSRSRTRNKRSRTRSPRCGHRSRSRSTGRTETFKLKIKTIYISAEESSLKITVQICTERKTLKVLLSKEDTCFSGEALQVYQKSKANHAQDLL